MGSPKGVLLASRNSARHRENGKIVEVAGPQLLASAEDLKISEDKVNLDLELLPNRDSTAFAKAYDLEDADTFFRGTLRFAGFSEKMLAVACAGLLEPGPIPELAQAAAAGGKRAWFAKLVGAKSDKVADVKEAVVTAFRKGTKGKKISPEPGFAFIEWLGLLEDVPFPEGLSP